MTSLSFKILETTPTKIIFQTKYPWAICLNANTNGKVGHYFLLNNSLNQQKIKKITPECQFSFSPNDTESVNSLKLRDYQQKDVEFLNQLKSAAIFSEMRTGKTPVALKTFQGWPITSLLIIVPAILQQYWQEAVQEWLSQPAYIITYLEKEQRNYLYQKLTTEQNWILIVSKNTFKLDKEYWQKLKTKKNSYDYGIIIDEAHFLRNYKTQQSKSIYACSNAPYKLVLTGTPTVNHQSDIFGILKFLQPKTYTSYWNFAKEYFRIEKFKISYLKNDHQHFFFRWEIRDFKNSKKREELQNLVKQFSVNRRQKKVLPWLPKIICRTEKLLMNEEQLNAYQSIEKIWEKYQPLEVLAKLKTLTLYPPAENFATLGCKIEYLIGYLQEKSEPIIVFSTRSETFLEPLSKILTEKKIRVGLITGNSNHLKKEEVIQQFQQGKMNILLANLQCAGLGLNLSRAETIIFADRSYSPADNDQAEARFLPVQQEENPRIRLVIDLVCKGTIDEKVLKLLKKKENLIKVLNERPESLFS